jgi:GAF domain-containing protein
MPIDPTELTKSIGALGTLDPEAGLAPTLQQIVIAAKQLFEADAAGLMLIDAEGSCAGPALRTRPPRPWRTARSAWPRARAWSPSASGPRPRSATSATNPSGGELGRVMAGEGICAALTAPVEVDGSAIGTLDIYSNLPWDWDDSEIAALQTYGGLVASLLTAAVTAQVQGRLANQLQAALEHRWLIEQAKGMVMGREGWMRRRPLSGCGGRPGPRPGGWWMWPVR